MELLPMKNFQHGRTVHTYVMGNATAADGLGYPKENKNALLLEYAHRNQITSQKYHVAIVIRGQFQNQHPIGW
jgi:hypothetical protein